MLNLCMNGFPFGSFSDPVPPVLEKKSFQRRPDEANKTEQLKKKKKRKKKRMTVLSQWPGWIVSHLLTFCFQIHHPPPPLHITSVKRAADMFSKQHEAAVMCFYVIIRNDRGDFEGYYVCWRSGGLQHKVFRCWKKNKSSCLLILCGHIKLPVVITLQKTKSQSVP